MSVRGSCDRLELLLCGSSYKCPHREAFSQLQREHFTLGLAQEIVESRFIMRSSILVGFLAATLGAAYAQEGLTVEVFSDNHLRRGSERTMFCRVECLIKSFPGREWVLMIAKEKGMTDQGAQGVSI